MRNRIPPPGNFVRNRPFDKYRRLKVGVIATLCVVSFTWLSYGLLGFFGNGIDLELRWQEVHTMLRGFDPNMMYLHVVPDEIAVLPEVLDELRVASRRIPTGVNPPWSYVIAIPVHWPADLTAARRWYLLIFGFSLIGCGLLCLLLVQSADPASALFSGTGAATVASVFASSSFMIDLRVGNWATFTLLCLLGCLLASCRGRYVLAGVLLGLAALKPAISAPFGLFFLLDRTRWPGAASAAVTILVATAFHWARTGIDPVASFMGARAFDSVFSGEGGGVPALVESQTDTYVAGAMYAVYFVLLAVGLAVVFSQKDRSVAFQFALIALISATWTYQRHYHFVVLTFVYLWVVPSLWQDALSRRRRFYLGGIFLLLGATTWPPPFILEFAGIGGISRVVLWWLIAAMLIRAVQLTERPAAAQAEVV